MKAGGDVTLPGYTADASLNGQKGIYGTYLTAARSKIRPVVELALIRDWALGLECGGSCPTGELLCKCDNNCVCCSGGCFKDTAGYCKCGKLELSGPLAREVVL